jgi:hypothetical protein
MEFSPESLINVRFGLTMRVCAEAGSEAQVRRDLRSEAQARQINLT